MKVKNSALLSLITGAMEICWIYSWVSFTMTAVLGNTISLLETAAAFSFAIVLTNVSTGHGWRVVTLIITHILGCSLAVAYVLHGVFYPSYPIFNTLWISLFFTVAREPMDWVHHIFILICVGLTWLAGTAFAKRRKTYSVICARFDIGLAAFFILLLAKLTLRVKGGINVDDSLSSALIYPFLLLSIIAIGITRVGHGGVRRFLPGRGGSGILMSTVSVVILIVSTSVFLLLPVLTQVADTGQRVLKGLALWILPVVSSVVRFMFMGGQVRSDPSSGSPPGKDFGSESLFADSWWMELLEVILRKGIEKIAIMFFAFTIALLIYLIMRWLFSRTAINSETARNKNHFLPWYKRLWQFLRSLWKAVLGVAQGYKRASELFSVLTEWGRRSGLPRLMTDTPFEFGIKLCGQFPKLKMEIETIINALTIEIYGKEGLKSEQLASAVNAWYTLRSPVYWPRRLKMRIISKIHSRQGIHNL